MADNENVSQAPTYTSTMLAVRRKLNVTWADEGTDARLQDVVDVVSPRLASLLGYPAIHEFTNTDGQAWGLFLNACLYEFSDAWDDFEHNYADVILSARTYIVGTQGGDGDAQSQG